MKFSAEQIAEIIHSVSSLIPRPDGSSVGSWADLPEKFKINATNAVIEIMNSHSKTAEELHNLWMQPLLDDGWVVGNYNRDLKQHPCLVPFDQLPESEVLKDEIWFHMTECFRKYYSARNFQPLTQSDV